MRRKVFFLAGVLVSAVLIVGYIYFYTVVPEYYREVKYPTPNITQGRNRVQGVVLHHTATFTVAQSLRTLTSSSKRVSCHVLIGYDGTRYILAEPRQITHHAGQSILNGRLWCNNFTIGIEFQGCTNVAPLTNRQIASAVEYLKPLIKEYGISLDNIVTHEMVRTAWNEIYPAKRTASKPDIVQRDYQRVLAAIQEANLK